MNMPLLRTLLFLFSFASLGCGSLFPTPCNASMAPCEDLPPCLASPEECDPDAPPPCEEEGCEAEEEGCPGGPEVCAVLDLVNAVRATEDLAPLRWDGQLALAAQAHAEDMAENQYFSHDSQDGRTWIDRIEETDYAGHPAAENIAHGYATPEAVMDGWMNSPGHRANILSPRATDLGVGLSQRYWVQVFGTH